MDYKFKIHHNNFYVGNDWIVKLSSSFDKNLFGLFKHPHLEQSANVKLLNVTGNFWSILSMPDIFYFLLLLTLILPLFYCLLTVIFFLKNQI